MITTERQRRDAIVAVVVAASARVKVYNRLRRPEGALISEFNTLNVDSASKINVCFVRRVSFVEEVSTFDDSIASVETYLLYFYRGIEDDDGNGSDSENELQLLIETVRAGFKAAKYLGFDPGVSQGGMETESGFIDCNDFNWDCHRFVGRLNVTVSDC